MANMFNNALNYITGKSDPSENISVPNGAPNINIPQSERIFPTPAGQDPNPDRYAVPIITDSTRFLGEADQEQTRFHDRVQFSAESPHGLSASGTYTPIDTHDAREKKKETKSKDIGYGHKIKDSETEAGTIYGIPFIDKNNKFIPLSERDVQFIYDNDVASNLNIARTAKVGGWDAKIQKITGGKQTFDNLPKPYRKVLGNLAYNVGGTKAANKWTDVLTAAFDNNPTKFAKELRRQDSKAYTKGMDNRVLKDLYGSGFIKSEADLNKYKKELPLGSISYRELENI